MASSKIFAIGFGFKKSGVVRYMTAFEQNDHNFDKIEDFIRLSKEHLGYSGGNALISMAGKNLGSLVSPFGETGHKKTVAFLEAAKSDQENALICIMETCEEPKSLEESFLVLEMFSLGVFNALNPEHRKPLTKVFGRMSVLSLSFEGFIPEDWGTGGASFDMFPSYLYFKDRGTNRFVPTSYVRYGSHIGEKNTLMYGVTVNFGVSVGDENLLDGHCSIASCVQLGSRNKVGSFVSIEGVLSPVNENPVIIGDDNFFGTMARIGTGLMIGNKNFWGSGVNVSLGTPLKDMRSGSATHGKYVKAGTPEGVQGANETMIILNRSMREIEGVSLYPGEFVLFKNTQANQDRFYRNDDLTAKN